LDFVYLLNGTETDNLIEYIIYNKLLLLSLLLKVQIYFD